MTNYLATISLYTGTVHEIVESHKSCILQMDPSYLIFDEDQAFLSSVIQYIYKR